MSAPATESHPEHMPARPPPGRRGVRAGIGVAVACAVACSLPLLVGGTAVAGAGALLSGARGVALVLVAAAGAGWWYLRNRSAAAASTPDGAPSCGCGGACGG